MIVLGTQARTVLIWPDQVVASETVGVLNFPTGRGRLGGTHSMRSERVDPALAGPPVAVPRIKPVATMPAGGALGGGTHSMCSERVDPAIAGPPAAVPSPSFS